MRKEDKYRELIHLQEDSGLSIKEFCSNQNIARASFYYWRKKIRAQNHKNGFIPLLVKPTSAIAPSDNLSKSCPEYLQLNQADANGTAVELAYPNGVVLRLKAGVTISDLRTLINLGE